MLPASGKLPSSLKRHQIGRAPAYLPGLSILLLYSSCEWGIESITDTTLCKEMVAAGGFHWACTLCTPDSGLNGQCKMRSVAHCYITSHPKPSDLQQKIFISKSSGLAGWLSLKASHQVAVRWWLDLESSRILIRVSGAELGSPEQLGLLKHLSLSLCGPPVGFGFFFSTMVLIIRTILWDCCEVQTSR